MRKIGLHKSSQVGGQNEKQKAWQAGRIANRQASMKPGIGTALQETIPERCTLAQSQVSRHINRREGCLRVRLEGT
jgi:hypothetical protein